MEALSQGVILLDSRARVLDMNPAAQQIFGKPAIETVGRPVEELLAGWEGVSDLLRVTGEQQVEVALDLEGNAGERTYEVRVSSLHDLPQSGLGGTILLRDITVRKRVEQELLHAKEAAEASDRAKSEFMSVASHELRTPITAIKGYADLLAKGTVGPVNEVQADFLDTIRTNVDRIALLVSDLSDMARIESGRLRLEIEPVRVEEIIADAIEQFRTQIEEKNQTLHVEVPQDLPVARADSERTVQVLSNLIGNAHKFTPAGGRIAVQAAYRNETAWEAAIVVCVADDGIGIRPEEHGKVFEKFYRSDDRKASDIPGSGLGLSIAARLVEMQGGEIWLESVFREGTTVGFTLPTAS